MNHRCLFLLLVGCLFFVASCASPDEPHDPSFVYPSVSHDATVVAQLRSAKVQNGTQAYPYVIEGYQTATGDALCPDWHIIPAPPPVNPYCVSHRSVARLNVNGWFIVVSGSSAAVEFVVWEIVPTEKAILASQGCVPAMCPQ